MELPDLQTPAELISIDQALIDRQPPEFQRLLQVVMAFVQQMLDLVREMQGTIGSLRQTNADLQKELQEFKQSRDRNYKLC